MCGRFAIAYPRFGRIESVLGASFPAVRPRYNIAPSVSIPVVRQCWNAGNGSGYELVEMRWGLVPHWAKEPSAGFSMFNARSETVDTKPAFRDSFRGRRCLVPATGFYEWKTVGDKKAPHYFTDAGCEGFAFAGLWDLWQGQSGDILSCTVLVCPPNEVVAPFHDRMPVILPESDYKAWLEPKEGAASLRRLLSPYPAERMRVWPVSPAVGNPRNDSPSLIEPLPIID